MCDLLASCAAFKLLKQCEGEQALAVMVSAFRADHRWSLAAHTHVLIDVKDHATEREKKVLQKVPHCADHGSSYIEDK